MFNIRKLKVLFAIIMSTALIITGCSHNDDLTKNNNCSDAEIVSIESYYFI